MKNTRNLFKYSTLTCLLSILGLLSVSVFSTANSNRLGTNKAVPYTPQSEKQIKELTHVTDDGKDITLPLRVFIITDVELEKNGVKMSSWITPEEVEREILPEVNRIWKPAGIQWTLESINVRAATDIPNKEETITYIENSVRGDKGTKNKSSGKRPAKIIALCGKKDQHKAIHNLYFFPYLGQTFQGFASMRGNTAYIGEWTDKHTRGKKVERALLTEKEPMKRGSIARTVAHELGHNLGLVHPDKATQTKFNRIMGGRKQGYTLTNDEIKTARAIALKRVKQIK